MSTILVTGGTGFLGQHLVHHLVESGDKVRVLARTRSRPLERLDVEWIEGSILDRDAVRKALGGCERVIHAAGLVSRDADHARQMYQVHVDGTRLLCEVACELGVDRLVVVSSSGTIGVSTSPEPVPDESAPYPIEIVGRWPYYLSKIYQEQVALSFHRERSLPVIVVNPSLLLGPGDDRLSSTRDVLRFLSRQIPSLPPGGVNFVDARDAAIAIRVALEKGKIGQRYLLGGPNWTVAEFFTRLERCSKVDAPVLRLPKTATIWGARLMERVYAWRDADPPVDAVSVELATHYWYVDSSKARRELGFSPREPGETLADTVRYVREHFVKSKPARVDARA
jgi:dihydroflavonol-4-reductase